MEKLKEKPPKGHQSRKQPWPLVAACLAGFVFVSGLYNLRYGQRRNCHHHQIEGPYGKFPKNGDPFRFIPCTDQTLPPRLDDPESTKSWKSLYDPDPQHWSWGNGTLDGEGYDDPYAGQGIFLCGYIDVPLDYTNKSDTRITRLAVTKYQVSGLAREDGSSPRGSGRKSERTIVLEPGGPGGSGTSYAWRAAELVTKRFSEGKFDALGWDPRGVNVSLPAISCFPYDADRDHWSLLYNQYLEVSSSPITQLQVADALNDAVFYACWKQYGDLPRFVSTAFVARDLEEIRKALGEEELTGYLVSYGTGIGQTYANMFPNSVGRMILDGTEYVRDHRLLGGFGWTALDNTTDAWRDGFIGECINAGPEYCALARPKDEHAVTKTALEKRMKTLVESLIERPIPGYTDFSGPSIVTYSALVMAIYDSLYNARSWPALAHILYELEDGNSTLATALIEGKFWGYDPTLPPSPARRPSSEELSYLVICSDSYDAPQPSDGLKWWTSLWANMTTDSWVAGNSRFQSVFPCRHFTKYWPEPAEVYRGDLNKTLRHPVLLIAETYDPATPLRNGRRLLAEMGDNARLIAHHGYGHSSRDSSNCTDSIGAAFILYGKLPEEAETACYANEKPYLYDIGKHSLSASAAEGWDPVEEWIRYTQTRI
ncbi:hypothetical protein B0T10DRAFT_470697 [Thelonectria olida]|uniref:Peptidase S33 tripeptidyl aminopeptidase-like C-terminal domain-containing protein n=1 Tax=Thelonectria olida TaxID=1576542 RepID=A0A9P8WL57_9HYPO|nr:hypothetical protein B0T10DRAFT_470697 [Thelonectria olida]